MNIEEIMLGLINKINTYFTDCITVILLLGCGIYFTLKTGFVQLRCFKEGLKNSFGGFFKGEGHSKSSSFTALATAVAAQIGVGNIVGASSAIIIGGPGSIFWMWITAFFGMATVYVEALAAQKTRMTADSGESVGGTVYYIIKAFKGKAGTIISKAFAFAALFSLGFIGSAVQSNAVAQTINSALNIPSFAIGGLLFALCTVVFLGGADRIMSVAEKIVPIMAGIFILVCVIIMIIRIKYIPDTFALIFRSAFAPYAILGGGAGYSFKLAVSQGVKRGLFSNEAGMGSTPYAHALARVSKPHDQAVVAMIGVFVDTFVILTLTAVVMISVFFNDSGYYLIDGINESNMMQAAVSSIFGDWTGKIFTSAALFFFGFASILGWNLFGKINFQYLFGKKFTVLYYILSVIFICLGASFKSELMWSLADLSNSMMVIPNVISLFVLRNWATKLN